MAIKKRAILPAERPASVPVERIPSMHIPPAVLLTGEQFADEIGRLWKDAQSRFLEIGRRLNEAFDKLEHGEYGTLLERLPFERATADKLRKVAAAADAQAVPIARLPPSYSTVYEVLTLTPAEREEAEQRGLIRPDVKRQEIVAFKRSRRQPERDELAELRAEERRLAERLKAVRARIRGLTSP